MRVLFFAHLQAVTGCAETSFRCENLDMDGLWRELIEAHPGLERYRTTVRLALNAEYARPDSRFRDEDEVALIPPVSGG